MQASLNTFFPPPREHVAALFRAFRHALKMKKAISELPPCAKGPGRGCNVSNEKFFKSPIVNASKREKKARCERRRQEGETKKKLGLLPVEKLLLPSSAPASAGKPQASSQSQGASQHSHWPGLAAGRGSGRGCRLFFF